MGAGPLGRTGRLLLELLGVTKNAEQFLKSMGQEVLPTINATPFLMPDLFQEIQVVNVGFVLGANAVWQNTSNSAIYLLGGAMITGNIGAGNSLELRMAVQSNGSTPFYAMLTDPDAGSGATAQCACGWVGFENPIVMLPGWRVTCFVTELTGAIPNINTRLLIAAPVGTPA